MTSGRSANIESILRDHLGVDASYVHVAKRVGPSVPVESASRLLKWYEVYPADRPVPPAIATLAREALTNGPIDAEGLGFVVLHRCGADFYFLIVATWRNENELWESVFYKNGDAMAGFELFARPPPHLPTYCVWELVPLWHEQGAWVRFLTSERKASDTALWLNDQYRGDA